MEDIYAKEENQTVFEANQPHPETLIETPKETSSNEEPQKTFTQQKPKPAKTDTPPPKHGKITKKDFKDFAGLKILVAEDNIINQKVIAGLLNESGIELVFAGDGLEALSLLNNMKDFDLVLMDAHMPNMDGYEATRKIRSHEEFRDLPVIALSGDVASDDIKKMLDAGMDAHLEKPLKMDAFYETLYRFVQDKTQSKSQQQEEEKILDTTQGIALAVDDEAFYKEILKEFLHDYKDAHLRIDAFIDTNQLEEADRILLDLSGITANIGAQKVQDDIVALRKAIKENTLAKNDIQSRFHKDFARLINEITDYL